MLKFIMLGLFAIPVTLAILDENVMKSIKAFKFRSFARFVLALSFLSFLLFVFVQLF